jgi:AcrR family transcriptional regulator
MDPAKDGSTDAGVPDTAVVPEPAWRAGTRAPAAPRLPLTRQAIVEAALRVLDREGLEGLSMRKVGDELGTGPASIYWHVRNKGELLQLLYERVTAEVELPEPDPSRWIEQLEDLSRQLRRTMHRHRDIARISMGRIPSGPTIARLTEWLFRLMTPVGIPDRTIAYVCDMFGLYVGAFTFEESLGLASPTGENLPPGDIIAMFRDYMTSLPEADFPHLQRASEHLFDTDIDARFAFGIDIILRGLRTYADEAKRDER